MARRNVIANATALIRATRGRGIVLSSEARRALQCRAPFDVMNLATIWGLKPDQSRAAVTVEAQAAVTGAYMRRRSYKGAVHFVDGGGSSDPSASSPAKQGKKKDKDQQRPAKRARHSK
jgi:ribonuclease P/MRP protein subunit RPP1